MILPSQTSKFDARKNKKIFIGLQVSEAYIGDTLYDIKNHSN